MKNAKRISILAWLIAAVCLLCSFGCGTQKGSATVTVLTREENTLVLTVSDTQGEFTLLNCLQSLAAEGEIEYETKGTMLTAIGGVKNDDATFSYWMIYTSDTSNANAAWGSVEYNGATLSSAAKGISKLQVKDGCLYVFCYQTMSF